RIWALWKTLAQAGENRFLDFRPHFCALPAWKSTRLRRFHPTIRGEPRRAWFGLPVRESGRPCRGEPSAKRRIRPPPVKSAAAAEFRSRSDGRDSPSRSNARDDD